MRGIRAWFIRVLGVFDRGRRDREFAAELQSHLQLCIDENVRNGMTLDEARRAARLTLGGVDQTREQYRDRRIVPAIDTTLADVRYGLRLLRKHPTSTAVGLLTLAIGIGANTAVFSVVKSVLLVPLPVPEADRIVYLWSKTPTGSKAGVSIPDYLDWAKDNASLESMADVAVRYSYTLPGTDGAINLRGTRVSSQYFQVFGLKAALGRTFTAADDQNGHVVILSHELWASQFGSDPAIVGRSLTLSSNAYTVIGVMPPLARATDWGFTQLWTPVVYGPEDMVRTFRYTFAVARLKRGVTLSAARADMDLVAARLAREFPDSNKGWGVMVDPYSGLLLAAPFLKASLYILLGAAGLVLLIGCVNLANMALARGLARQREVAIRVALGGGRTRLIRQFLTENLLVSFCGGALGLMVGYGMLTVLKSWLPGYGTPGVLPSAPDITMDGLVLSFTLAITLLSGLFFGLLPALRATRVDASPHLKEGESSTHTGGTAHRRVSNSLVVGEVALAFVLLTAAGLLIRSFDAMQHSDTGFDSANVVVATLPLSGMPLDRDQRKAYLQRVVDEVVTLPGVLEAALSTPRPMFLSLSSPFEIDGHTQADPANPPMCFVKVVSASYFRALGLRLRRGRILTDRDVNGAPHVAVINETMAKRHFSHEDPIGKHVRLRERVSGKPQWDPPRSWEIVGVIVDELSTSLSDSRGYPGVYLSHQQSPNPAPNLVVRTSIAPGLVERSIRQAVAEINRDQAVDEMMTLDEIKAASLSGERLRSILLAVFAVIALLLAAIGIYGVISYSVLQRTHEFGIRAALGASPGDVIRLVLRSGMTMTGVGMGLGLIGAAAGSRLLRALLFGVGASDPVTWSTAAVTVAGIAVVACYVPARRASRVKALIALKAE